MSDPQPPPPTTEPMSIDAPPTTNKGATSFSAAAAADLSNTSEFLSRHEVLRRRSDRVKKLAKIYRSHYWALMEELRAKYKEYYWMYGKSPYRDDCDGDGDGNGNGNGVKEEVVEEGKGREGSVGGGEEVMKKCGVAGCKTKPMALTRFCHPHILSDAKQKLYTACTYVIKSGQAGPIFCGKPILKSTVPSLCPTHFQKAEKHVARALKKAGLNVASPSKVAPKLHVVVAEYVRQIQTKRRAAWKAATVKVEIKEEKTG